MFTILLHSSKTMRHPSSEGSSAIQPPLLLDQAGQLASYLKTLSQAQIETVMGVSPAMAVKTRQLIQDWHSSGATLPAIDAFLGDIYSGLQVQSFSSADRQYANTHLFILSGLYGVLRALDEIQPYRLEMGYKLPGNTQASSHPAIQSLYTFWGDAIARQLPPNRTIVNLSAVEYTKAVFSHLLKSDASKKYDIITPKFLTISPKTGEPVFVTVHAKIARGAFARWLIQNRITTIEALQEFNEVGYRYSAELSTPSEPVYIAQEFKGIGLSVRLT